MRSAARVETIDLWRGLVLVVIFINHVPGNPFEALTPRNFGVSDSAEAFVFLSGLAVAYAYAPRLARGDVGTVTARAWRRALLLYGVHLLLTVSAVALFANAFILSGNDVFISAHGRDLVFDDPARAVPGLVLLGHQLGYFNILPLYVVLMLAAPLILWGLQRRPITTLAASFALYAAVQVFGINLPNWPGEGGWFFNPLAWQFLFTLGIVVGFAWREGGTPLSPALLAAALALLLTSLLAVTDAFGRAPGLLDRLHAALGGFDKTNQGPWRLLHFLALAYVIEHVRLGAAALRLPGASAVSLLGRNGLAVFAAGSLLSGLGQVLTTLAEGWAPSGHLMAGMLLVPTGLVGLYLFARHLECPVVTTPERLKPAAVPLGFLSVPDGPLRPSSVSPSPGRPRRSSERPLSTA